MVALVTARIIEPGAIGVFLRCKIITSKPWDSGQYPCTTDNVRTCAWPYPQAARNAPQMGLVKTGRTEATEITTRPRRSRRTAAHERHVAPRSSREETHQAYHVSTRTAAHQRTFQHTPGVARTDS